MNLAIAYTVGPGEGERIQGPAGGPLTFKARGAQTGERMTLLENVIAPGDGPPLHTHAGEDESWYVLEGRLRFRLDDQLHAAPAGSFVFVPRGTPHCFQNTGTEPARILVIFTPPGWSGSSIASQPFQRVPRQDQHLRASAAKSGWRLSGRHLR